MSLDGELLLLEDRNQSSLWKPKLQQSQMKSVKRFMDQDQSLKACYVQNNQELMLAKEIQEVP